MDNEVNGCLFFLFLIPSPLLLPASLLHNTELSAQLSGVGGIKVRAQKSKIESFTERIDSLQTKITKTEVQQKSLEKSHPKLVQSIEVIFCCCCCCTSVFSCCGLQNISVLTKFSFS